MQVILINFLLWAIYRVIRIDITDNSTTPKGRLLSELRSSGGIILPRDTLPQSLIAW